MNIEHTIKAQSEQLSNEVELSDAELATVQGGLCPGLVSPAVALLPADVLNAGLCANVLNAIGVSAHVNVLGLGFGCL